MGKPASLVRLKHQGRKCTANPWPLNANSLDGTLLQPVVAAKVLHLSLLASPFATGVAHPCGEAVHRPTPPRIGDSSLDELVHLEACALIHHQRHTAGLRAIERVANDIAPGETRAEQTLDPFGAPRDAQRDELRPGDLTVVSGTHALFLDFSVTLQVENVRKEARSSYDMVLDRIAEKHAKYQASFARVSNAAKLLPFVLSAYGGSHPLSNAALKVFADAVEARATAPTPLGMTPLYRRMLDGASAQVRAAAARHSLAVDALYHDDAAEAPPSTAFAAPSTDADALVRALETRAQATGGRGTRAAALLRALAGTGSRSEGDGSDTAGSESDAESDGEACEEDENETALVSTPRRRRRRRRPRPRRTGRASSSTEGARGRVRGRGLVVGFDGEASEDASSTGDRQNLRATAAGPGSSPALASADRNDAREPNHRQTTAPLIPLPQSPCDSLPNLPHGFRSLPSLSLPPQFNTRLQTSPFQHSNGSLSDPARTDCIIPFAANVPAPARPPFAISAQRPLTDTPPFTHTFGGHPSERVVSPVVEALVRSEGHGDISGRITMEELDWHSGGRAQESAGAGT